MIVLADFLGWNSHEWTDTIGLGVVFFVIFPALVQGLIMFAAAQGMGERANNQKLTGRWGRDRAED